MVSSFHGTLTVPVQNLLASESIAPWVRRADMSMYKEIIVLLSPLALQVVPQSVLHALRSLEQSLPNHVRNAYSPHPEYLRTAKLEPVEQFADLLARLLRVNATAHAAAKFLSNPADCALMLRDWTQLVNIRTLVEHELPCGSERAIEVLECDIPALLSYSQTERSLRMENHVYTHGRQMENHNVNNNVSNGGVYNEGTGAISRGDNSNMVDSVVSNDVNSQFVDSPGDHHHHHHHQQQQQQRRGNGNDQSHIPTAIEGAIDRWAAYLQALPQQFPSCPPRVFLWAMESIETAVLREITISGGEAFGLLWVVRCWIDEWMIWLAERGGFLASNSLKALEKKSNDLEEPESEA